MVTVAAGLIPQADTDAALRRLWLDVAHHGLSAREVVFWRDQACWFPHLRHHPDILRLRRHLPEQPGEPCEAQILWHLPHDPRYPIPELSPHVDAPPPWAGGRRYSLIAGVPLTGFTQRNGGLVYWDADKTVQVEAVPGDVILMDPCTQHSPGVNRSGQIRAAVYFRFLTAEGG